MKFFFTTIFIFCVVFLTSCSLTDSPENAFEEIRSALNQRDLKKFLERVDTEKLLAQIYEDATVQLAKECEGYGNKYPRDPYFQHGGDFIKTYNAEHCDLHLEFARQSLEAYFSRAPEPEEPAQNPYAYVAHEFEKLHSVSTATIEDVQINGNHATLTVEVQGDSSLRGIFVGLINFQLGFDKIGGAWKLTSIENIEELTPSFVDRAELVWINL